MRPALTTLNKVTWHLHPHTPDPLYLVLFFALHLSSKTLYNLFIVHQKYDLKTWAKCQHYNKSFCPHHSHLTVINQDFATLAKFSFSFVEALFNPSYGKMKQKNKYQA